MNPGKALSFVSIAISVCACIGYAFAGDVRRSIYWGAAAVLTSAVTF